MRRRVLIGGLVSLFMAVGAVAFAATSFTDVPDNHLFANEIEWMKDNDITRGCNPPANTKFCPEDFVTRGQMSAFFYRFAHNEALRGEKGDPGQNGVSGYEVTNRTAVLDGKGENPNVTYHPFTAIPGAPGGYRVTHTCDDGKVALSGGIQHDSGPRIPFEMMASYPVYESGVATGWTVEFSSDPAAAVRIWVVCADIAS